MFGNCCKLSPLSYYLYIHHDSQALRYSFSTWVFGYALSASAEKEKRTWRCSARQKMLVINLRGRWGVSHPSTLALQCQVAALMFGKWSRCNWVPVAWRLAGQVFSALTLCVNERVEMFLRSKCANPWCTWAAAVILSGLFSARASAWSLQVRAKSFIQNWDQVFTHQHRSIKLNPQGCFKSQNPKISKMREIQWHLRDFCHLFFFL